jgi:hypothetical protein
MMTRKSDTDPMGNILRQRTTLSLAVPPASRQQVPPADTKGGGASPVVPPSATAAPGLVPAPVRKGDTDPMGDPLRARTTLPLAIVAPKVESAKANEEAAGRELTPSTSLSSSEPASASELARETSAESPPAGDAPDFEIEDGKRPLDQSEIRELFSGMARAMEPTLRKVAPESEAAFYVEPHAPRPRNLTGPEEPAIIVRASAIEPLPVVAPAPSAPPLVSDTPPAPELAEFPQHPPGSTTVQTRPLRSRKVRERALAAATGGAGVVLLAAALLWHAHAAPGQPSPGDSVATIAAPPPRPPAAIPNEAPSSSPEQPPVLSTTTATVTPALPSTAPAKRPEPAPPAHVETVTRPAPPFSVIKKPAQAPQPAPRSSIRPPLEELPVATERK